MAFRRRVSRKGKTWRLITRTRPPSVKKAGAPSGRPGTSWLRSPRFCMKRIQPMEAMYGGVMKGTRKRMSNALCRAMSVRENRYASGAAMTVDVRTTRMPSRRELAIIRRFSGAPSTAAAGDSARRPSRTTALRKTESRGHTTRKRSSAPSSKAGARSVSRSRCMGPPYRQSAFSFAAVSEAMAIILSHSAGICGMSASGVPLACTSLRPGMRYASATICCTSSESR